MTGNRVSLRVTRLASLVEAYRALLETAQGSAEWQTIREREVELRRQLESVLQEPLQRHEADAVRIQLQELLVINHALSEHIERQRSRLFSDMRHANQVRRAAVAYRHTVMG